MDDSLRQRITTIAMGSPIDYSDELNHKVLKLNSATDPIAAIPIIEHNTAIGLGGLGLAIYGHPVRLRGNTNALKPHPDAFRWLDHAFFSPTYQDGLDGRATDFLKQQGFSL